MDSSLTPGLPNTGYKTVLVLATDFYTMVWKNWTSLMICACAESGGLLEYSQVHCGMLCISWQFSAAFGTGSHGDPTLGCLKCNALSWKCVTRSLQQTLGEQAGLVQTESVTHYEQSPKVFAEETSARQLKIKPLRFSRHPRVGALKIYGIPSSLLGPSLY